MAVYNDIRTALEQNVSNITNVPSSDNRAYDNFGFKPTTGTKWIRASFQPSRRRPQDVTADGLQRYQGLFIIDVFAPEDEGAKPAEDLADNVVDAFEAGTVLSANNQDVEITYAEIANPPQADSPWFRLQVSIGWKAFA